MVEKALEVEREIKSQLRRSWGCVTVFGFERECDIDRSFK